MASPLGVPVKLLHEALGHIITVELKTGQMYRGKLLEGKSPPIASWWLPQCPELTLNTVLTSALFLSGFICIESIRGVYQRDAPQPKIR